ncbi:hypothetical protein AAFC00_006370 [Neodothiora populina]|uniref:2-(3-amino-3-carboxypropyl)histidine synthase subunit 2 n=1 Tax=Neodothiora populina TaxID=2781224 RepID=A0ABR3P5A7_9PEZI
MATTAPVLSTPDVHIFEDPTPPIDTSSLPSLSDDQLYLTYEIKRTVNEIRTGRWKRVALQFPDEMLCDAPRVFDALQNDLIGRSPVARVASQAQQRQHEQKQDDESTSALVETLEEASLQEPDKAGDVSQDPVERLCILADTSYGACCVDELAAEHTDADVVVHYGRTCLSPTARLPVIYVFTSRPLEIEPVVQSFKSTFPDTSSKVVLMADIPYASHVESVHSELRNAGYTDVFATSILHDPSSPLPNRSVPHEVESDPAALQAYSLFHISDPPTSLLLNISSRLFSIYIYPTTSETSSPSEVVSASTAQTLRRRYALVTRLSTASVFGILINTLSVKNYMHALAHVQKLISRAGKKAYTFVVGKVNAAKVANFSEVDGWVVIGCWESSLIESKDFWKPIITPFELELALTHENERIWTGEWNSNFQALITKEESRDAAAAAAAQQADGSANDDNDTQGQDAVDEDSEEESEPPVFDLRTGRYLSQTRPMARSSNTKSNTNGAPTSLIKRANGDLAQIGGEVSLGAQYLRTQRTWQGLGTDYEIAYEFDDEGKMQGAQMEEGRSGVARGYTVGDAEKH